MGLQNGPTIPQWEVEICSQKPWETSTGKEGEGRKDSDAVIDLSWGGSWNSLGSIERQCRNMILCKHSYHHECAEEELQTWTISTTRALSFGGPSSWEVPQRVQSKPGSDTGQFVRVTECKSFWGPSSGYWEDNFLSLESNNIHQTWVQSRRKVISY